MQIDEGSIYTSEEARKYLKVSNSTIMRMLKKQVIQAAKIGKQYRIMGKEILRLVSPKLEDKVGKIYNKGRKWAHEGIDDKK